LLVRKLIWVSSAAGETVPDTATVASGPVMVELLIGRSRAPRRPKPRLFPDPQQVPPTPPAAVAATALRPGKAHEALAFRLAVEVGHPLACQLSVQVIRQHPSSLLGCAGVVVWSDGRERTARGHHAKVDALVECC
jgi:hypothetical protein